MAGTLALPPAAPAPPQRRRLWPRTATARRLEELEEAVAFLAARQEQDAQSAGAAFSVLIRRTQGLP